MQPPLAPDLNHHYALWAPEMATKGGLQAYMWRLWNVLEGLSVDTAPQGLTLNDSSRDLQACSRGSRGVLMGADRSKLQFLRACLHPRFKGCMPLVGHLHHAPIAWALASTGRIRGYIVILHGIEAWKRRSALERRALRAARWVAATSQFTARTCAAANGLHAEQCVVIPLCGEPRPAAPDSRFHLNGAYPILFVGRLEARERYKGLEMLIEAAKTLNERSIPAHLHVVGDGDDRERLEGVARNMQAARYVTFCGRLDDSELQAAYRSAHVFAMPSAGEGFGIVFVEAMRHGVPCIGGNHGGTPEVIEDGATGYLVDHGDVHALVERLAGLWRQPDLRVRIGEQARQAFHQHFAYERFASRWTDLLLGR